MFHQLNDVKLDFVFLRSRALVALAFAPPYVFSSLFSLFCGPFVLCVVLLLLFGCHFSVSIGGGISQYRLLSSDFYAQLSFLAVFHYLTCQCLNLPICPPPPSIILLLTKCLPNIMFSQYNISDIAFKSLCAFTFNFCAVYISCT